METLDKEKDLLTRRMEAKLQTLLHMAATFNRYTIYCQTLDKEKDLLTRRMGAKLQTLLHMAATFNRYTI